MLPNLPENHAPASFELEARDPTAEMQTSGKRKVERLLRDMGFGFVGANVVLQDPPNR